ncbi:MAG: transglycosylase SLT domain-containing protein [Pseudomonadota bacterium]|nr:transglycosylase SLT domain-containing protein [Pseudomonadota bacterium]
MIGEKRGFILLLLLLIPPGSSADVYKYVDAEGKTYFTDAPLEGKEYRLEWKRAAKKIVAKSNKKIVASGRRRLRAPPKHLSVRRARYATIIEKTATRFDLHPELLHAVVRTESAYNPSAVSSAGAVGLMQLMPATASRFRVSDIWDPAENLRGGAEYLRHLLDLFEHDLRLALAAYNAGENAVAKYGNRIPPYPETQRYVRKVLQYLWAEKTSAGS